MESGTKKPITMHLNVWCGLHATLIWRHGICWIFRLSKRQLAFVLEPTVAVK